MYASKTQELVIKNLQVYLHNSILLEKNLFFIGMQYIPS
jgi:hypothetical protein